MWKGGNRDKEIVEWKKGREELEGGRNGGNKNEAVKSHLCSFS